MRTPWDFGNSYVNYKIFKSSSKTGHSHGSGGCLSNIIVVLIAFGLPCFVMIKTNGGAPAFLITEAIIILILLLLRRIFNW